MFDIKDYFFEIQLLLNIFMISAIVILAFLHLKFTTSNKSQKFVDKIEYLCKNLKELVEQSEKNSETIRQKVQEFKTLYNKNISDMENKLLQLNDIVGKLEHNVDIKPFMDEKDKQSQILHLLNEGHSVADVAKVLKMNIGEVELIKKLKVPSL